MNTNSFVGLVFTAIIVVYIVMMFREYLKERKVLKEKLIILKSIEKERNELRASIDRASIDKYVKAIKLRCIEDNYFKEDEFHTEYDVYCYECPFCKKFHESIEKNNLAICENCCEVFGVNYERN